MVGWLDAVLCHYSLCRSILNFLLIQLGVYLILKPRAIFPFHLILFGPGSWFCFDELVSVVNTSFSIPAFQIQIVRSTEQSVV